jgi:predicted DNA-binding ribbon-helix-helix protein
MSQATYLQPHTRHIRPAIDQSLALEGILWDALDRMASREGCTVLSLVTRIDNRRGQHSIQSALRIIALAYLRAATSETPPADLLDTVLGQLNPN